MATYDLDNLMTEDPRTGHYTMTVDDVYRLFSDMQANAVPLVFDPVDTNEYYPDPADPL